MNKFNRLDLCENIYEAADIGRNSNKNEFELDPANNYYGIKNVIKKYADLPKEKTLYGSWPHGIHYDGLVRKSELSLPYIALYSYETYVSFLNLFQSRFLRYKPMFLPSCVPIVFAKKIFHSEGFNFKTKNSSIIIFPSHSSLKLSISSNIKKQINLVNSLRKKFKSVSLCVAWKDVINKTYCEIYDLFDNVYCAGHQYDKDFLYNLITIFYSHTRFTGDYVGSYLWYGLSIGCKPFFNKQVLSLFKTEKQWTQFDKDNQDQKITFERVKDSMKDVHSKSLSVVNRLKTSDSVNDFYNLLFKECNFFSYQNPKKIFEYEELAEKYFKRFGKYSMDRNLFSLATKIKNGFKKR